MSSETKWTPGPWWVDADGCISAEPGMVAEVYRNRIDASPEEELANARLIAAAPLMVEALERVRETFILSGDRLQVASEQHIREALATVEHAYRAARGETT